MQKFTKIAAITLSSSLLAVSVIAMTDQNADAGIMPMIQATDQLAHGKSVRITETDFPTSGFVVIHAVGKDGKAVAPQHLGYAPIKAGVQQSITVKLDKAPKPGTKLIAMLHNDTGVKGKFEFGPGHTNVDKPMMSDGKPVTVEFKIQKK